MGDRSIARVREEERGYAAAAHLLNVIPLWGVVFVLAIQVWFRERSREVVFHAQQALFFHGVLLVLCFGWIVVDIVLRVMGGLAPDVAAVLQRVNTGALALAYGGYVLVCLSGVVRTMLGRAFLYPVLGERILEGAMAKVVIKE